jgi:feruloyl esterase
MKCSLSPILFIVLLASFALVSIPAAAQQPCENLMSAKIPNVTITSAKAMAPQWEIPATGGMFGTQAGQKVSVPFCRIEAFSAPTSDSHIGFEVWLPLPESWNGKFLAVGNPGFVGGIARGALAPIVKNGYATASTDTGHTDDGYDWAKGHPEKLVDWGHRAVHETAVAAKHLIQSYYGKAAQYSYWNSCHNGGNQGLNEAQRYPTDFNGIVAGDPAYYVSRLQAGSLYIGWVSLKDGVKAPGYIPPGKYPMIHKAALDACDSKDGLADGIIEDPLRCNFDPTKIQCPEDKDAPSCLTAAQVETAKAIYEGAKFNDGTQIYSGFEPGSELGWSMMTAGPEPLGINAGFFKGMVFQDPKWDFRTFNVDRDTHLAEARTGKAIDGFNPDLRPFKKNGGKLIIYMSWNETAVPPRTITDYYKNVERAMTGPLSTYDFARLFMAPDGGMCPGFGNAGDFDTQKAIEQWVEKGVAPDKILLTHREQAKFGEQGKALRTRPVCAYPNIAKYKGSGNPDDAANFTCTAPGK